MDYKKYFLLPASPDMVYLALTREATIELWTGSNATMQEAVDTEFSLWDQSIVGRNLEFEKDKKIVQEWYFGERDLPSIVTIKLHEHKKGTSVEIVHTNIPDEDFDNMKEGWEDVYISSLEDFFSEEES